MAVVVSPRRSALYAGRVRHRRLRPREHRLSYGVYHALLDLDELDALDREVLGFAVNRAAVTSFHDRDHLGHEDAPVKAKLAAWLGRQGRELPDGPVLLHTNLRVLGYVFNPVSWFFCHDRGGRLVLVVAEVHNTFGDRYAYLLDDLEWTAPDRCRARRAKAFHVSPFMDVPDHTYDFVFRPPGLDAVDGAPFAAAVSVHDPDGRLFDATIGERRRAFTTRSLWRHLVRYPLVTVMTIVAIHVEAARLASKRVPFFRRPAPPADGFDRPLEQTS